MRLALTCLGNLTTCPPPPPDDLNGMAPELPVAMPSGPFRHVGLSKAARTHRLRKLRSPAKCRECNSYVYFQGAECEEVSGGPGGARHLPACAPSGRCHAERWREVKPGALAVSGGRASQVEGSASAEGTRGPWEQPRLHWWQGHVSQPGGVKAAL